MKKAIILIAAVLCLATVVQAAEPYGGKRNYMTFSLGGYWPGGDLEDEGFKSGGDFNFSYMRTMKDWFGFGAGAHTYGSRSKNTLSDIGDSNFFSTSVEMLFYVQPNHWQFQPYFGIGPAIYYNFIEYKEDVSVENVDESGVGLGIVAKVGVRAFITERFFGGIGLRAFSNQWRIEIDTNRDKTYDFGGGVLAFELGFTF